MKVERLFRGPAQPMIEVRTEDASARFPLEAGQKYLLFAYEVNHHLWIESCGNSMEFSKAGQAIKELDEILKAAQSTSGGDIRGRINWGEDPEVAGIRVVAYRRARKYEGVVDAEGWFHIHVPAGTYSVRIDSSSMRAISPKWIVFPYELSYDDPKHVVVRDGGCAELMFIAGEKQ